MKFKKLFKGIHYINNNMNIDRKKFVGGKEASKIIGVHQRS